MLEKANGDRRTARRAATKAEIVEAAWALSREQGLVGISLRDLAASIGMRAPSLYQYFDSKHAIYDAMFEQGARAMLEGRSFEIDPSDLRGSLRAGAHQFFDLAVSDPERTQLLFQRTIPGFEPSAESYEPAIAMIETLKTAFDAAGITDPDALDLWTSMLSGLVNQQLANDPGGNRYERLIDRAVDMFLAEMAPKKGAKT